MNVLTADEIKSLLDCKDHPCVSIYMPTHRKGKEIEQDPIRLKNLLRRAEDLLAGKGLRGSEVKKMLRKASALLENNPFWRHQSDGLAIFLNAEGFREYRLPIKFDELVVVTDRFHIKPILPMLTGDGHFYVLAFSRKQVRLLQASRNSVGEVDMEGMPPSLTEWFDPNNYQQQLQFHTGTPTRPGREGGKREAAYHGAGGSEIDDKEITYKYLKQLDRALGELLKHEHAPLVMAGVDYLFPIFREASKYQHLAEKHIPGNPDDATMEGLHRKAWEIVEPVFKKDQEKALQRLLEMLSTESQQASGRVKNIVTAAAHGRVDTLFVASDKYCWGSFDKDTGEIKLHEREQIGVEDLLDFAAINTLSNGGVVYAVNAEQLPNDGPMGAVFRY